MVVEVITRFRQNGNALLRELSQAVHGALQKARVVDDLVVVEEHHCVEPERVGHHQAEVAHGAVSGKADLGAQEADVELLHALADERELGRAHHERVDLRVGGGDGLNLLRRLVLDARIGRDQHDDQAEPLHLLKGREASSQLALLGDGRRVVVAGCDGAAIPPA